MESPSTARPPVHNLQGGQGPRRAGREYLGSSKRIDASIPGTAIDCPRGRALVTGSPAIQIAVPQGCLRQSSCSTQMVLTSGTARPLTSPEDYVRAVDGLSIGRKPVPAGQQRSLESRDRRGYCDRFRYGTIIVL